MTIERRVDAETARDLGLTGEEFDKIGELLGRAPNFTELGVFSAMWSEHCSYKNSRKLFKLFPAAGKHVLVGAGEENSGVVDIGDGLGAVFKMESHNHPSALEPFEASATGLGGCMRDIFTMGARPAAGLAALRFGRLDNEKVKWLFEEVVRGLAHYANAARVSVTGGDIRFDESYEGNPLVNAMVVGIVRHGNLVKGSACGVGNAVYYMGKDTGRDGVGGASFASKEIGEDSESEKGAVAIGDPELGMRLREACLELMEKGLVAGMQDMGAAGLTCSSCETAARSGNGIEIDVASVPRSEAGMQACEVLLSESQERMLAILSRDKEQDVLEILKKWNVNAVKIGRVIGERVMRVKENGAVICEIPPDALTRQAPLYDREAGEPGWLQDVQKLARDSINEPDDLGEVLLRLLDSPTIACKDSAYDKFTRADKSIAAAGEISDASVIRVDGTGKALAVSVKCNGRFCFLNPYNGAMMAVAEAARAVVCAGGKPLAVTDGLNFGNPMKPENYWQFMKCVEGLSHACRVLDTPVVSGNVSFYNENPKGSVDPTPMIGVVGLIEDADERITCYFKSEGDVIVLLGQKLAALDGSEYLYAVHDQKRGNPRIDMEFEKAVQAAALDAVASGIVKSAHVCSEGGLGVALAKCCIAKAGKMSGARIELDGLRERDARLDELLYGEAPSMIVISLRQKDMGALEKMAKGHSVPHQVLGIVGGSRLEVRCGNETVIDLPLTRLSDAWRNAIPSRMR